MAASIAAEAYSAAPGPRPIYHPGYYGAFVLDPDGNNVEAVWPPRPGELIGALVADMATHAPADHLSGR